MQLSIIVPIYNVEKYLRQCLDSLYAIKGIEMEIILVDDGSTDSSYSIMQEYGEKYPKNTVIITKSNGGLSSARNTGLNAAIGEYVAFIDSDDFIENREFAMFYQVAKDNKLDIAVGNMMYYRDGKVSPPLFRSEEVKKLHILKGTAFFNLILKKPKCFREEVVDDLYRREFLMDNDLYFQEGLLHEDSDFTSRAYLKAKRVQYIDIPFYYYRQRSGSIMSVVNDKSIDSLEKICYKLADLYGDTDADGKEALSKLIPSFYKVVVYRYYNSKRDYREKLKNYRSLYLKLESYRNFVLEEFLVFISPALANYIRKLMGKEIDLNQKTPEF